MTTVAFSHRPQAGISVGVAVIDGTAWISATFLDPLDTFSAPYARRRLTGRIERSADGSQRKFTYGYPVTTEGTSARGIVQILRTFFKPDPEENDRTFTEVTEFAGVDTRMPVSRDCAWHRVREMFRTAVSTCVS